MLSKETKKILLTYEQIISHASIHSIPCYTAAVATGLNAAEFKTGYMGLDDDIPEQHKIKVQLSQSDFNNYMRALANPETPKEVLQLFVPIFAFPEGADSDIRTLRVVFEMEKDIPEATPKLIE